MMRGKEKKQRTLKIFADCLQSGHWPGYAEDAMQLALSRWEERACRHAKTLVPTTSGLLQTPPSTVRRRATMANVVTKERLIEQAAGQRQPSSESTLIEQR